MSAKKQTRNRTQRKPRSDFQRLARRFMSGLLRSLFFISKPTRRSAAGFVLPTTVLLLLVMTLTVGALTFRTASRTQSTFLAREQQVIDNVAAPAIDRGKSKLEYLFLKDTRLPSTNTPASDILATLMLNIDSSGPGGLGITPLGTDPYTLPGEQRIDINNDQVLDNAWSFPFDLNGDGTVGPEEVIAYSVLMDDAVDPAEVDGNASTVPTATRADDIKLEDTGVLVGAGPSGEDIDLVARKAQNLVTRNGPLNTNNSISNCGGSRVPSQGWQVINQAALEKNFQITAFVSNGKNPGRANSALELQQVRLAQRGNTWGAWFKYDLELHPGSDFNWNGAIHTDGNLMVNNSFRAHMISSHNSCLYSARSSEVTLAAVDNDGGGVDITGANSQDFQGQLLASAPTFGNMNRVGDPGFHIFTNPNSAPTTNNDLSSTTDSVEGEEYDDLLDIALDPVALFTQNISRHRRTGTWSQAADWATNTFRTGGRIFNQNQAPPYLDDFFRADDRYGPRPNYENYNWVTSTDDGTINTARNQSDYDKKIGEEIIATDPRSDSLTNINDGLDGYWERKSIIDGMRVVVGQRLDLGNSRGWNFDASGEGWGDPLYPYQPLAQADIPAAYQNAGDPILKLSNKQVQRVTLRDNLAAVQGMVVYHYDTNSGQYPLACIANTSHPGTAQTLRNSRTFNINGGQPDTDFFNGVGTNGWEFSFPTNLDDEIKFGTALAKNEPLGRALRNLAYFAGDPNGGSPSFTPVQDAQLGNVHPFPHQAMWGDFSILRRIFDDRLDATTATTATSNTPAIPAWRATTGPGLPPTLTAMGDRYAALSPADKSSLHSAACTQGLLAYNLDSIETEAKSILQEKRSFMNTTLAVGVLETKISIDERFDAVYGTGPLSEKQKNILELYRQIERDRQAGFLNDDELPSGGAICNIDEFDDVSSLSLDQALTLRRIFCTAATEEVSKYPSLYYLFPKESHNQTGSDISFSQAGIGEEYIDQTYLTNTTSGVNRSATYSVVGDVGGVITDQEETDDDGISSVAFVPRSSDRTDWVLPSTPSLNGDGELNPESMDIKIKNGAADNNIALSLLDKVMYNGREEIATRVLDLDLGKLTRNLAGSGIDDDYWISNGREANNGIVYAVREDARREDSITRPASSISGTATTWADCNTLDAVLGELTNPRNPLLERCWMQPTRAVGNGGPVDPPLSQRADGSLVGFSVKPVDFSPDPDRRPYGFRLNADFDSNNGDLSDRTARTWGLTFVTDNAAYIRGKFNPHTSNASNGTDSLEEFTQTLSNPSGGNVDFGGEFYNNRIDSNLGSFATEAIDRWRVAEVLADSVSLLSNNFVDGSVEEGFIRDRDEASNVFTNTFTSSSGALSKTSFLNQQRPLRGDNGRVGNANEWLRVDGSFGNSAGGTTPTAATTSLPIWIGRNGWSKSFTANSPGEHIHLDATQGSGGWFEKPDERMEAWWIRPALIDAATPERMNATIISGLVPSRNQQGSGGLHNFPRFQEDWNGTPLYIQGAFLQLNFSTAATGPFDADAWEPGETPNGNQRIGYYRQPERLWGYDVGLQFAPAGPIAQRFVTVGRPRSESYRELPIDDAYVTNLRCAAVPVTSGSPTPVFQTEEGCP